MAILLPVVNFLLCFDRIEILPLPCLNEFHNDGIAARRPYDIGAGGFPDGLWKFFVARKKILDETTIRG